VAVEEELEVEPEDEEVEAVFDVDECDVLARYIAAPTARTKTTMTTTTTAALPIPDLSS
jgi:hypothetical protein